MSDLQTPESVAVVGAGTMGHGIAQVAAMAGYTVVLCDIDAAALARATTRIDANLEKGVARAKVSEALRAETMGRISTSTSIAEACRGATLFVEAIAEKLALKRAVFAEAEAHAPADAVLASNTSSLPLAQIAAELADPSRVIGMHFFNPVHIMALVEIVVHDRTSDRARDVALAVVRRLEKEPIIVRDSPGFASSRLGVVLGLEAMRMVEQDVASPADIDKAMVLGYKHPMGPLRLTDLVGLDVRLSIAETLAQQLGGAQYEPPKILRDKVAAGELGKKTGRGFYDWSE